MTETLLLSFFVMIEGFQMFAWKDFDKHEAYTGFFIASLTNLVIIITLIFSSLEILDFSSETKVLLYSIFILVTIGRYLVFEFLLRKK